MSPLDPRRNAYRPDLADERLRGLVKAERFVTGSPMRVAVPSIELHAKPAGGEPPTTEALLGEDVLVFDAQKDWAFVQLARDGYTGYLAREALTPAAEEKPTHRVAALWALGFKTADIKSPLRLVLPMGARVTGEMAGDFLVLDSGVHIPIQHVAPVGSREPEFVAIAERFVGTPYRWGGKTALGIDCSGLVQISLQSAGVEVPRDTDMQATEFGRAIDPADWGNLRRGDLVFWRGHVGVMVDGDRLLHANAHHMAVVTEPLAGVVERARARGSPITDVRRTYAPAANQG